MTEMDKKMAALARQFGHADLLSKREINQMAARIAQDAPGGPSGDRGRNGGDAPGSASPSAQRKGASPGSAGEPGERQPESGSGSDAGGKKPKRKRGEIRQLTDRERTKPNKWENSFYIDLMILRNSLRARAPHVKDRIKKANPDGWRDVKLLLWLVDHLQEALMATMPKSRDEYYATLARNGKYHLHVDGPIRQGHIVLITDKSLGAVLESAMEEECLTCVRDGRECEECMLRAALLEVGPAMNINPEYGGIGCEYRHLAGMLVRGEEIMDV